MRLRQGSSLARAVAPRMVERANWELAMGDVVDLYSFADVDRSGKVRWAALELGLQVEECRVKPGAHRKPPYTERNPYGHIPSATFQGVDLMESTAICYALADAVDAPKLQVDRGELGRQAFLFWMSVFTETLEGRLVECAVSKAGLLGPEYFDLHERSLTRKLQVVASELPQAGWLVGERFTLADICAGYSLRLAVQCRFLTMDQVNPYFERLRARPAAAESRIFASLV